MGHARKFFEEVVIPYQGDDCLFWPFAHNGKRYGLLGSKGKLSYVHVLVCERVNGPRPKDHEVRHTCGNGRVGCVAGRHLVWGTSKDNSADMLVHGTDNRGVKHANHKLTEQQVRDIRNCTQSQEAIGRLFGVSRGTVKDIKSFRTWKHI